MGIAVPADCRDRLCNREIAGPNIPGCKERWQQKHPPPQLGLPVRLRLHRAVTVHACASSAKIATGSAAAVSIKAAAASGIAAIRLPPPRTPWRTLAHADVQHSFGGQNHVHAGAKFD